jgi:hypothetical protein
MALFGWRYAHKQLTVAFQFDTLSITSFTTQLDYVKGRESTLRTLA